MSVMVPDFYGWIHWSKSDKLAELRKVAEAQHEELQLLSQRHDRLLVHLGLVEINGPRIVKAGSAVTLEVQ